jgi:hypothetical protein
MHLYKRPSNQYRLKTIFVLCALACSLLARAESNIVLWDTGTAFSDTINLDNRGNWKRVPTDLFALEKEPAKASSDPGYYGREYSFNGDAVVENASLTAVFWSEKGRVVLYSKSNSAGEKNKTGLGTKIAELTPLHAKSEALRNYEVVRNVADEVVLQISFNDLPAQFSFGKNEIIEIKPSEKMKGIHLLCPMEHGIVPGFVGDDLIFGATENAGSDGLSVPSENLFLGLLKGEGHELVMTWPKGKQQMRLNLGAENNGKRPIESVDLENDGQAVYLAALAVPGIWHREELSPSYLEKDTAINWKRPFPAKWKTELLEAGVKTTFAFRESKGTVWRGVPGSYNYPAWFEGENAFYHLSKKVPPKGESIIYFLEGQETPASVSTPVDILKATLGRQMADSILDVEGRKLRTHHRRAGAGVRRACTCGCTEAIQAVFEKGEEVRKKDYIQEAIGDMIYFVEHHMARIEEYQRFANDTIKFLESQKNSSPELKEYVESLQQIVEQIPQEYKVQQENMKSREYADELTRKTMALTEKNDPKNLSAYMDLLKAWRGMGGSQDYVVAQCHLLTRKLFQEAGYGCASQPKAVELAQEVRARCRQALRNPDGYEIWPNY